jgi:lipoyl(octanoyl) transferase
MIDWEIWAQPLLYTKSLKIMQDHVELMLQNKAKSKIMLVEHETVYTTTTQESNLLLKGIPLVKTNRGGGITYHGPGQRIIYPILDLRNYKMDLHAYLNALEEWIIDTLRILGINAQQKPQARGIWVKDHKIASIGVRFRKWIAFHGCAVNITTNMKYFDSIQPCGMDPSVMTSCETLGKKVSVNQFDKILQDRFSTYFSVN